MKGPYIPKEFRNNSLDELHAQGGKDFLKYLYH